MGAKLDGRHSGVFGDIGCFSFHSQKNMSTLGEGGMIAVQDADMAKKIPGLRLNGHRPYLGQEKYWLPAMTDLGVDMDGAWPMKSTMSEVQGAVGVLLIKRLDALIAVRRRAAKKYRSELAECSELKFQKIYDEYSHSHHLLPAQCNSKKWTRDQLIDELFSTHGVKAIIQYQPLNRYALFLENGYGEGSLEKTNNFFDNMISFPFSPVISDVENDYVISAIKKSINYLSK
jgi:dTDP-4-amino-4,6-dideoxygalactose transaminase